MNDEIEVEDMGPDNFYVLFETTAKICINVDTHSEEEAAELVRSFSPDINWSDAAVVDMGYDEMEVIEVWA